MHVQSSSGDISFFLRGGEGTATKSFYGDYFTIEGCQRVIFGKLSLESSMDVLNQTSLQVNDSIHKNTENVGKVHLCLTLVKVFSMHTHK